MVLGALHMRCSLLKIKTRWHSEAPPSTGCPAPTATQYGAPGGAARVGVGRSPRPRGGGEVHATTNVATQFNFAEIPSWIEWTAAGSAGQVKLQGDVLYEE